jgi:hypothetical protein
MAPRACLPGELVLDAIVMDERAQLDRLERGDPGLQDWVEPRRFSDSLREWLAERGQHIALRWVLNPALGIPLEPFTVWRRSAGLREAATPIHGWRRIGLFRFGWDGVTELQRVELDVTGPVVAHGLTRADHEGRPVTTTSGGPGTVVLEGGPMVGVHVNNPSVVTAARGLSTVTMANGSGWDPVEIVGLPFGPDMIGATYYSGEKQGPVAALTDPVNAAMDRLKNWGPQLGWATLAGLPEWRVPDAFQLVEELRADVLSRLVTVLQQCPPPQLAEQHLVEVTETLPELRQLVGTKIHHLGGSGDNQRSELRTRPVQAIGASVSCDVWASLGLGFGTGAPLGKEVEKGDDFMVTTRWRGMLKVPVRKPWPWPWLAGYDQTYVSEEVERELAAVVLSPRLRTAPAIPAQVTTSLAFVEGASDLDKPYQCASAIRTTRPVVLAGAARVSAYGVARFDGAGSGQYSMREHPRAGGWIPVGSAVPVRAPEQAPDPELAPETVLLRDSGVPMPVKGASNTYEYALAAADLFGQWSPWAGAWFSVGPADVQAARVAVLKARATPGAGDADPCHLDVSLEVVWDRRERSCSRMRVAVTVANPPAPPAAIPAPPDIPAAPVADVLIAFDAAGDPVPPPAGVTVTGLHPDDTPVTPADPATGPERRYRISFTTLSVTYGSAKEKAVAAYVLAEETVRPGEWTPEWSHSHEFAIAPNPLPPPAPAPLPAVYPDWASLPDAAGISYAGVRWQPTGAWRYRVYEATEAALLAACGKPGPDLTAPFGGRMQALFDLYKVAANLPKLKSAYRKLGEEPVSPPVVGGWMRYDTALPRGSGLIHCYVVVGVTETNVVSSWPAPDANGRKGFLAYATPRPLRTPVPEVLARLDGAGVPEVTVRVGGELPATAIRLYRAANALLARHVGTMQLVSTTTTDPGDWQETVLTDPAAPKGWRRLQYRAVAVTEDDPDHAGMAVDSVPSKSFALLNPPAGASPVTLVPNAPGTTVTTALVRVTTNAPRTTTDIGDHTLAWVVTAPGTAPARHDATLNGLPELGSVAALVASTEPAAYVMSALYLRLPRTAGQVLGLTLDLTDPLGRGTHLVQEIPAWTPDPAPKLSDLKLGRSGGVVSISVQTNAPTPPDPAREWTFAVGLRAAVLPGPMTTTSFAFSGIQQIRAPGDMPDPAAVPDKYAIRRVGNQILMWVRATVAQRVLVALENSEHMTTTIEKVSP